MSDAPELRILTGCHAGARALLAGGERLGADDLCDLLLTDLGLPAESGAWVEFVAGHWWVRSDPPPPAEPGADGDGAAPASAWIAAHGWGVVAYLGHVAITVSPPDAPWQSVPPGLAPVVATPSHSEAVPEHAAQTAPDDSPQDDRSGTRAGSAAAEDGSVAAEAVVRRVAAPPAPTAVASRRWHPAWIIGAALAALLLSVFWSLLAGREGGRAPTAALPDAASEADSAHPQRLLREIQLAIARVDPALRLRVDLLPAGGARVSGWVSDIAQLDRLADGLAQIRPVPALSVRTASELVDDLVDHGGPDAPALRFELLGEGRVRVLGLATAPPERDKLLAALRARVPPGIDIVDGLRVVAEQGGPVQQWLRTAGFAAAEARWDGAQMVIGLDMNRQERARLESLLARPGTPLSGIPFVLRAREVGRAPGAVRPHASAAPLPFGIRSVVGGAVPYVVLRDGTKLQPGGRRAGWRLVAVEPDRLVFDGPRVLEVLR